MKEPRLNSLVSDFGSENPHRAMIHHFHRPWQAPIDKRIAGFTLKQERQYLLSLFFLPEVDAKEN